MVNINIIIIRPEDNNEFTTFISEKVSQEDENTIVPDHYIENELKTYLNNNFDVSPKIPLRE